MRRLLVTGGAGFIGSNFIRYWIARHPEDRVVNLDALTYAGNPENLADIEAAPGYRFEHGDIADGVCVAGVFADEAIDTVVNFAAESHVDRSILGPEAFIRTNVQGTFTLLEAARTAWGDFSQGQRFLHVSTDEVYGSLAANDPPFTESHAYAPNSPYSATKAASDHLVRAWRHTWGLPVLTTNCSNNYGPYQFPEKLIPLVILNALEGKPIPVYGDGHERARLAVRRGPLPWHRGGDRKGHSGRGLQHRRRQRVAQPRYRQPDLRPPERASAGSRLITVN